MFFGKRVLVPFAIVSALVAGVCAAAPPAVAAAGTILDSGSPDAIAGQYTVAVQPSAVTGSTTVASLAQSLTSTYGGTFGAVDAGFDMFDLNGTDAIAQQIAGDARVKYVDQDENADVDVTQDNPDWGLDRVDQRKLPVDGKFVYSVAAPPTIYVVDSGIRITNVDFGGRASYGYSAIDGSNVAPDCSASGHGTHVAGIAAGHKYGVAKQAKIVAVKVFDCDSQGKTMRSSMRVIVDGLNWIKQHGTAPAVVNMSLGGNSHSVQVADAVAQLQAMNFTVVLAAGNSNVDACTGTAGSSDSSGTAMSAIVVGATTQTDSRASFSNFGSCLTLFAPGDTITSAGAASDTASAVKSGTSMATPFVSGAAALLLAATPSLTPAQVMSSLVANATTPGTNGGPVVGNPGAGSPDRLLYIPPPAPQVPVTVNGPPASQPVGSGVGAFDFTFAGTAGQTIYVNGTAGSFNATITLYDPLGTQLGSGNHFSSNSGKAESWINPVSLPVTGTYSIHINPSSGASGPVSVQVLTYANATASVNGAPVSATVPSSLPGQRIAVTFSGTARRRSTSTARPATSERRSPCTIRPDPRSAPAAPSRRTRARRPTGSRRPT